MRAAKLAPGRRFHAALKITKCDRRQTTRRTEGRAAARRRAASSGGHGGNKRRVRAAGEALSRALAFWPLMAKAVGIEVAD